MGGSRLRLSRPSQSKPCNKILIDCSPLSVLKCVLSNNWYWEQLCRQGMVGTRLLLVSGAVYWIWIPAERWRALCYGPSHLFTSNLWTILSSASTISIQQRVLDKPFTRNKSLSGQKPDTGAKKKCENYFLTWNQRCFLMSATPSFW